MVKVHQIPGSISIRRVGKSFLSSTSFSQKEMESFASFEKERKCLLDLQHEKRDV